MIEKYWTETIDIENVEFAEVDLEFDSLFHQITQSTIYKTKG